MKEVRLRALKKKLDISEFSEKPIKHTRLKGLKGDPTIKVRRRRKESAYKIQQCSFIKKNGERCRLHATGSSIYCTMHGGVKSANDPNLNKALLRSDAEVLAINASVNKTKFNPETHPLQYIKYSFEGKAPVEIAKIFGISKITLHNWAEAYASFYDAYHIGATAYEAFWVSKGVNNLDSTRFNTPLYKFLTGNLIGFSEKTESRIHQTTVTGVLVIPAKAESDEAWEEEARSGNIIDI